MGLVGGNMCNIDDLDILFHDKKIKEHQSISKHMSNGVIFESVNNIIIDDDVVIGKGTKIYSNNIIKSGSRIGQNCTLYNGNEIIASNIGSGVSIKSSYISDSNIGNNCTVGPFANVHTNSAISRDCRIGNFVEIKNSVIGINTKMAHLVYIGDADIGDMCNIGCGTIFVNYDGKNKHRSYVGDSVFIGSNCNIIAPVKLDNNAFIAAGTTVTVDLPKNCMCIGRNREIIKENASKYRKLEYSKKYFGTDGIRGLYGEFITEQIAYMCGNFLGYSAHSGNIVIGRDTRTSGLTLLDAMEKGILDAGCNVVNLSITSSPCVAYVTALTKANYGIMITASHNPAEYNGIKIFNFDGRKLTNIEEIEIEKHIERDIAFLCETRGHSINGEKYIDCYVEDIVNFCGSDLHDMKIVIDCANGGTAAIVRKLAEKLPIYIHTINDSEEGDLINYECGAVFPHKVSDAVKSFGADIGFAFDGDGDRIITVDRKGRVVNGDLILLIIAKYLKENNRLTNNKIVGTVMTNLGVEETLKKENIELLRTDVGDHYVVEEMLRNNLVLGGERSGHIIFREFSNTGDGVLVALFVTHLIVEYGENIDSLINCKEFPTFDGQIRTKNNFNIVNDEKVKDYISNLQREYDNGRIIFRASGTEPLIRISAEYPNYELCEVIVKKVIDFILENYEI